MATITYTTKLAGVLTNVTSVVLSNEAATIGIKRNDTGATVVAAGTAFTNSATGTYTYTFTAPSENIFYTAYVKITTSGQSIYHTVVYYIGITDATVIVPSAIVAEYVIGTLDLFSAVSEGSTWPLYRSNLPDSDQISHNIAAIFDTSADIQSKLMSGDLVQRYGIQFLVRSTDYDTGYEKSKIILETVQTTHNASVSIGGTTFIIDNFSSTSGVLALGVERDSKQRYLFSTNFLVTIKEQ